MTTNKFAVTDTVAVVKGEVSTGTIVQNETDLLSMTLRELTNIFNIVTAGEHTQFKIAKDKAAHKVWEALVQNVEKLPVVGTEKEKKVSALKKLEAIFRNNVNTGFSIDQLAKDCGVVEQRIRQYIWVLRHEDCEFHMNIVKDKATKTFSFDGTKI